MLPPAEPPVSVGLTRRRFVGAGLGVLGSLAAAGALGGVLGSCSSDTAADEGPPLLALGRSLSEGPDGDRLAGLVPVDVAAGLVDELSVLDVLSHSAERVRADLGAGRTALGRGWVLSDTEAAVLVAYARG